MGSENELLQNILEEIQKSKNEIKSSVEACETRILLKIETLKNRISEVEKENEFLKDKIETLEQNSKKKNIILFGLNTTNSERTVSYVCELMKDKLGISIREEDVSDLYSLGNYNEAPLKVELLSVVKKRNILKNCTKLKNTGIVVTHDLTQKQREENKILRESLNHCSTTTEKSYIKGNKLHVGSKQYTVEDLKENDYSKKEEKSNSAPPTPIANLKPDKELTITQPTLTETLKNKNILLQKSVEPCNKKDEKPREGIKVDKPPNKSVSGQVVREKYKTRLNSNSK
ncbi:unnamed protein product [Psylliodes chrysocephalus]|uniref:Endonuclease-reverse transcriptase n=1 Tax=Psylliodes chrysocephalus TaxID=3402493 RepID=A0A9P0CNI4_9CUCU|nr:unnamed protein product [Psylliodes chrysocephala]